jgi:hypothetical protein
MEQWVPGWFHLEVDTDPKEAMELGQKVVFAMFLTEHVLLISIAFIICLVPNETSKVANAVRRRYAPHHPPACPHTQAEGRYPFKRNKTESFHIHLLCSTEMFGLAGKVLYDGIKVGTGLCTGCSSRNSPV